MAANPADLRRNWILSGVHDIAQGYGGRSDRCCSTISYIGIWRNVGDRTTGFASEVPGRKSRRAKKRNNITATEVRHYARISRLARTHRTDDHGEARTALLKH